MNVVDEELVSCDFLGNPCSAVIDAPACVELNDKVRFTPIAFTPISLPILTISQFFKIVAWYDNEWAYSSRILDMIVFMFQEDQRDSVEC
jgi:glyceraldehyde 3-phosphate dehydrogenase